MNQKVQHPKIKLTFLGTGTSQGVPVIGCECDTCLSGDRKDNRLRTSVLIQIDQVNLLIDAGPDLRQQMLRQKVHHLNGILITHEHNDHTIGLDDIRPFNFMQGTDIPIYGLPRVLDGIKSRFSYVFSENPYPGSPRMMCVPVEPGQLFSPDQSIEVCALSILHGTLPILGFKIGRLAYITDASEIPEDTMRQLHDVDTLVVNCLRYRKHPSHFNFDDALSFIRQISPRKAYLTHLSHEMGLYEDIMEKLPPDIKPAFDGLSIECP